jgi:hypothetical protein
MKGIFVIRGGICTFFGSFKEDIDTIGRLGGGGEALTMR